MRRGRGFSIPPSSRRRCVGLLALRDWLAGHRVTQGRDGGDGRVLEAGKRRSGRSCKGSKWPNQALKEFAMAALRTNGSYRQALYRRKKSQGHARALGAVKHSILCAIWHMLTTGEFYRDLGGDYYQRRDPERQTRRPIAQLERLGHTVTLQATATATATAEAFAAA